MKIRGFTLLELIVVIAIIGVLSVVVLPNFATALQRGRDGRRISELKGLQSNLLLYYQQFGGYPTNRSGPANNNTYGWQALVNTKIVDKLPSGATRDNNGNVTLDPGSSLYRYVSVGCPNGANTTVCASYVIWTQLETSNVALDSDADVYGRIETGTANNNLYTIFPFLSSTNPCNQPDSNGLFTGCAWLPQKPSSGLGISGSNEECISRNANNNTQGGADCVFDLVP